MSSTRRTRAVEPVAPYRKRLSFLGGLDVTLRRMGSRDLDAMLAFGRLLSEEDLLLLRTDLNDRNVLRDWIDAMAEGRRSTVLAEREGAMLGYGSLSLRGPSWYRHLGEIRVVVRPDVRGRGLGTLLTREVIHIARQARLTRLIAQIPRIQGRARNAFRRFGFQPQVMLPDWVMDTAGHTHDLVLLTLDLD